MIKKIDEFHKYITLAGFRDAKIMDIGLLFDSLRKEVGDMQVQLFDARFVAGWKHLYFATLNALNAFANKQNISKSLAVESLLFASAQKQISVSVEMLGVKTHSTQIVVLLVSDKKKSFGLEGRRLIHALCRAGSQHREGRLLSERLLFREIGTAGAALFGARAFLDIFNLKAGLQAPSFRRPGFCVLSAALSRLQVFYGFFERRHLPGAFRPYRLTGDQYFNICCGNNNIVIARRRERPVPAMTRYMIWKILNS